MKIESNTSIPYEFGDIWNALRHVESRCHGIKKSLRKIEKTSGHLVVRCPLAGDYLDIYGDEDEIDWLDNKLEMLHWYR